MTLKRGQRRLLNILVSAGPTREPIDPVRFISNYSTGLFGYEIAKEAKARRHRVILISGPTALARPSGVRSINICTARQMKAELNERFSWCDCLIMSAAVCDFRAKTIAKKKLKKTGTKGIILPLRQNPDILRSLGRKKGNKVLAGLALETEKLKENAQNKLKEKNLDIIAASQIKTGSCPFGPGRLSVLLMDKRGNTRQIRQATKQRLAQILLDSIEKAVL